ncbi:hypothetical protein HPB51_000832 [Rhipicephalus microplus]|uniref:Uncharacterized protein n=1 Tax=Rhipicephalus microplus TaxID=6941 RepID=A0A9J6EK48_RHIMP|nr:hypothetical protein HPB51_000832 [Rhipicephalus microplus]
MTRVRANASVRSVLTPQCRSVVPQFRPRVITVKVNIRLVTPRSTLIRGHTIGTSHPTPNRKDSGLMTVTPRITTQPVMLTALAATHHSAQRGDATSLRMLKPADASRTAPLYPNAPRPSQLSPLHRDPKKAAVSTLATNQTDNGSGDAAELPTRADAFRRLREYRLKASARATIAPPAFPHSLRPGSTQRRPALWPHRLGTDLPDALDEAVGSPPSTLLPDTIDDLD